MWIVTARFSKRKAVLWGLGAAAVVVVILATGFLHHSAEDGVGRLDTNDARLAWLSQYGWKLAPDPIETLQLQMPETLPDTYTDYNELQKTQDLDLSDACGHLVTRYTYTVLNYPGRSEGVQLNLYLCEGLPVAGDVLAAGADGFQAGLAFPKDK